MSEAPRIIVSTIARPAGTTGLQTHFNTFLAYLREQGTDCSLVTPFDVAAPLAGPVFGLRRLIGGLNPTVNVWWYETWHYRFLQLALRRTLADGRPAVIYAQCPLSARAALAARATAAQRVVMAVHYNVSQAEEWAVQVGLPRDGRVYNAIRERERRVLPALDGIVYVSGFVRQAVEREIGAVAGVPAATIPNFVDEPRFTAADAGASADLISIGSLEPRKNQAYLLAVLAEAKRLGRDYCLTLAGDGPDRGRLEALAQAIGVAGQVRFLGFQTQARRLLLAHRVYVHSARLESFGIALVEAMAAGLPLCAAPSGGVVETFRNGQEGFYWDLDDPHDGACKLIRLLEDETLYTEMAVASRHRFRSQFETSAVAGRLRDFLLRA